MTDPFAHFDGAYLLGALDAADRRAFEEHLRTCDACRARVDELRGTADRLAALPRSAAVDGGDGGDAVVGVDAGPGGAPGGFGGAPGGFGGTAGFEPVPDTLLPGLLRRAAQERRHRRQRVVAVVAVLAACVAAFAFVLAGRGSSDGDRPPAVALSAVRPNPLAVSARVADKPWGTSIDLHCTYPAYEEQRFAYVLVVVDKAQAAHEAGTWALVPGQDGVDFTGGTSVPRRQIDRIEVRTPGGTPLLQLKL